jgi:putative transposase
MPGRTFSREFKRDVVRQLSSGAKRPAHICREYHIAESVFARWRKQYTERGGAAFGPREVSATEGVEHRVAELERLCGQRALENAVLKKALQSAWFQTSMR